jgi:two-component system, OmpR family, phosphate regulon sensor histidine kinase PhoR
VPESLRGRLALTYSAVILLIAIALGAAMVVSSRDTYTERLADELTAEARLAAAAIGPLLASGADASTVDAQVKRLGASIEGRLTVIAADGRVLADSRDDPTVLPNQAANPESRRLLEGAGSDTPSVVETDSTLSVAVRIPDAPGDVVRVTSPLSEVDAAVARVRRDVIGLAMIGGALAAAVAFLVARRIAGPIDALRRHAVEVSSGRLDVVATPVAPRELADLARSFNAMTARIRELVIESERSRSRLAAIFDNLTDGVVIVDEQGTVLGLNGAATTMLGTNPVWAVGHPLVVVARDHDLVDLMRQAFAADQTRTATIEYARGDRVIEAAAQPVAGVDDRFGIVVLHDVTSLRRLESVRREFVANVSHELRTPLASIRAVVETLEAGAIDDPAVAGDFLGRIIGEVDRLTSLVEDLLDLARLESGRLALKVEPVAPVDLVTRGAERLRPQIERARLQLVIEAPADLPLVLADRGRIEQVLLNLIHNAIKFTPAGGTITVAATVDGDALRVSVHDTGVGIPESELPRIFERFYKADRARRSEGTGLGLAIAKHIVQAHRGTIHATSAPGQGSCFFFTLPLATPRAIERPPSTNNVAASTRSGEPPGAVEPTDAQTEDRARLADRRRGR